MKPTLSENNQTQSLQTALFKLQKLSSKDFLDQFEETVQRLFGDPNSPIHTKLLSKENYLTLLKAGLMSTRIPEKYGGRKQNTAETLTVNKIASQYSLPLSLLIGINGALFFDNIQKFGSQALQEKVFKDFGTKPTSGAFLMTEPAFGTNATHMETSAEKLPTGDFKIEGTKHWQGLSGVFDWCLIAVREKINGLLSKNISFFAYENANGGVDMEKKLLPSGLALIQYGRNKINTILPAGQKLNVGTRELLNMLHSSRLQFPAMGLGAIEDTLNRTIAHTKHRLVQDGSLFEKDETQAKLFKIQAWKTITQGLFDFVNKNVDLLGKNSPLGFLANSVKALASDYTHAAATLSQKLYGAQGCDKNHEAQRAVADSYPFTIFEGENSVLYDQIGKMVRTASNKTVFEFFKNHEYTKDIANQFKDLLNFSFDPKKFSQRRRVLMGQITARLISFQFLKELSKTGLV